MFFFIKHSSKYITVKYICVITWWRSASSVDSVCFVLALPTNTLSDTLKGAYKYLLKDASFPKPCSHTHPSHIHLPAKMCVSSFPTYISGFSIVFLLPRLAHVLACSHGSSSLRSFGIFSYLDPVSCQHVCHFLQSTSLWPFSLLSPFGSWRLHPRNLWKWKWAAIVGIMAMVFLRSSHPGENSLAPTGKMSWSWDIFHFFLLITLFGTWALGRRQLFTACHFKSKNKTSLGLGGMVPVWYREKCVYRQADEPLCNSELSG